MNPACKSKRAVATGVVASLLMFAAVDHASAIDAAGALRKIARVADDVPIAKLDDVATEAASSRFARDLVEKAGGRFDDVAERTKVLRKILKESAEGLPPSVVKQLDALEGSSQEAMAVLAKGSKRIGNAVPDVAERGRLLAEGGAETLLTVGRYEDLADDAVRFSTAVRASKLPKPSGGSLSLEDFGDFFVKQGDRGKNFWDKYVKKNWKVWLGSAALATVLATPDEYLDQAGNLLEGAAQKLARVGGRLLGVALTTAGTFIEATLWELVSAFVKRPLGATIVAVGGLLALNGLYRPLRSVWGLLGNGTTQSRRRRSRPST